MQKQCEAPELTLIGPADEVVPGAVGGGNDCDFFSPSDFEFEQG